MSVLDEIVAATIGSLEIRKKNFPLGDFKSRINKSGFAFSKAISAGERISLIAEIKRSSPSKGELRMDADVGFLAEEYEAGGASAISLVTEEKYFGGRLNDIDDVRSASRLPVLRKDFIIDPYQIYESAFRGFSAVLLIVAVLEERLGGLVELCGELGLDALVEVHSEPELATALSTPAKIIGINNRDLRDFSIDLETSSTLAKKIPDGILKVSESGINGAGDVALMREAGFDAVLVGELLMKSDRPAAKIGELLS